MVELRPPNPDTWVRFLPGLPNKDIMDNKPLEGELLKKGVGAPRKYYPALADKYLQYRSEGKTKAQTMLLCDIRSWETLTRWQADYPEFRDAVLFGDIVAQAYWENVGEKGILGEIDKFSASTYIFKMCNQFKEQYKQQNNGTSVNINNINGTSSLSTEDLETKALELSRKLLKQQEERGEQDV